MAENTELSKCRILFISRNAEFANELAKSFRSHDIVNFSYSSTKEDAYILIKQTSKQDLAFHFLILDLYSLQGKSREDFFDFFKQCTTQDEYKKMPLVVLCDTTSMNEYEKALYNKATDSRKEYTKYLTPPITQKSVQEGLQDFYHQIYPDGLQLFPRDSKEEYQVITIPANMDALLKRELHTLLEELGSSDFKLHIFNFKNVTMMPFEDLRFIFQELYSTRTNDLVYRSINIKDSVFNLLKSKGLLEVFKFARSTKIALTDAGIKSPARPTQKYASVDVKIVNPFIMATINVFKQSIGLALKPESPSMIDEYNNPDAAFATIIQLSSPSFTGSISQIFTKEVFAKFFSLLTQKESISGVEDVLKMMNEMLLQIYDSAKSDLLEKSGYELTDVEPKVISGLEKINQEIPRSKAISVPLSSNIGNFTLLINSSVPANDSE